jgi:hypothetical protein
MTLVINPAYKELSRFAGEVPEIFATEGEPIYKGRNELRLFRTGGKQVVVKSFKVPHLLNRIAYASVRPSKAKRSYLYSLEILTRGFHTPAPVAYINEFKGGLLTNSFYISEYTEAQSMKNEFCFIYPNTKERSSILRAFAAFTARLHEAHIYHPDYSNGNILYSRGENGELRFELVDVNRIQFRKVGWALGCQSFHRMDLSVEMLEIVAAEYARRRQLHIGKTVAQTIACNIRTMKPYTSFEFL